MRKEKREEHSGKAGKLAPVLVEWVHTNQKSGLQDKPQTCINLTVARK